MLTDPPSAALDLLVVGGLTVDRFADGTSVPGGSVLHITRAAAPRGVRVGVVTNAGPEAEAQAGLEELHQLAHVVEVTAHEATATFRHDETPSGRTLRLERPGGSVKLASHMRDRHAPRAILFAPIAGEVSPEALGSDRGGNGAESGGGNGARPRGAILQGWLRSTVPGQEVEPLPLSNLPPALRAPFVALDVIIGSREDLRAEAATPVDQIAAMRRAFGRRPILVVTDGRDGLWIEHRGSARPEHAAAPWLVDDVPTVGAGDVLAAFLTMNADRPPSGWQAHVAKAMRVVAEELEARKRR
jgi:sugar/nucleoside kinase (ribokinase family)